uniref:Uncharacterized protein n=1 Tax=Glossina pallidipes TaxID=7398 RepID=A0A1B0AGV7_GLOPL
MPAKYAEQFNERSNIITTLHVCVGMKTIHYAHFETGGIILGYYGERATTSASKQENCENFQLELQFNQFFSQPSSGQYVM